MISFLCIRLGMNPRGLTSTTLKQGSLLGDDPHIKLVATKAAYLPNPVSERCDVEPPPPKERRRGGGDVCLLDTSNGRIIHCQRPSPPCTVCSKLNVHLGD